MRIIWVPSPFINTLLGWDLLHLSPLGFQTSFWPAHVAPLITQSLKDISAHRMEAIIIFPTVWRPGFLFSFWVWNNSSLVRTFAYVLPLCLSNSSHTMAMNDEWRLEVCLLPTECIMQRGSTKHMLYLLCHLRGWSALEGNRDNWEGFSGMLCLQRSFNSTLFRGHLEF